MKKIVIGLGLIIAGVTVFAAAKIQDADIKSNAAIQISKFQSLAAHTYVGNNTGSSATPVAVTSTQLTADLNQFTSTLQGLVPGSGGGSTNFLRADGTWAAPAGTGVSSISVATANGLAGTSSGGSTPTLTLSTTVTGLLKGNATSISAAVANTDYLPATSGSAIQKANGAGGLTAAVAGTDYVAATTGSAIQKANGAGGLTAAVSGTDYAPATSGSAVLLGNGLGGFSNYAGSTCTNQAITALSTAGAGTCSTITSSYVDTSIAKTGVDINTSNQVTATHLAAALPVAQGGTGTTTAPSSGQILVGNAGGTAYAPQTMSGDATLSNAGALTIANSAVTNAKMANMATLTIKSNITGGSAAPSDNSASAILDAAFSSTQGSILYRNASSWVALAPGTAGYVLSTGGAGANPSWVASGGGGGLANPAALVRYTGYTSYGSTNTNRIRFTTLTTNNGAGAPDLTPASTAAAGTTITINTAGVYCVSFSAGFSSGVQGGIVLNDGGTTRIDSVAVANIVASNFGSTYTAEGCRNFSAADVISVIGDGSTGSAANNTGGWAWQLMVQRVN